jgi:hypothetical protein
VLGRTGAGKSVLAIGLAQQLSRSGDETALVPVVVSLSSWNPNRVLFADWLKGRLATMYPSLSAMDGTGRRIADALVDERRVLPVLDGLDEMSPSLRDSALAALGRLAPFPFVLTCRTGEYLSSAGDTVGPLHDVVAVEVEPLRPSDIRAYLGTDDGGATSDRVSARFHRGDPRRSNHARRGPATAPRARASRVGGEKRWRPVAVSKHAKHAATVTARLCSSVGGMEGSRWRCLPSNGRSWSSPAKTSRSASPRTGPGVARDSRLRPGSARGPVDLLLWALGSHEVRTAVEDIHAVRET